MNHDELREALWALHDNELGDRERAEVLTHLESCAECRTAQGRLERMAATVFRAPASPTPTETERFVSRIMQKLESEQPAQQGWLVWLEDWFMVPALSMGLAALLVSIVLTKPERIVPTDELLLVHHDSHRHPVGQWVLPPDPYNMEKLMTSAPEE